VLSYGQFAIIEAALQLRFLGTWKLCLVIVLHTIYSMYLCISAAVLNDWLYDWCNVLCRYASMLPTKEMHLEHLMSFMIFQSSRFCVKTVRILLVSVEESI